MREWPHFITIRPDSHFAYNFPLVVTDITNNGDICLRYLHQYFRKSRKLSRQLREPYTHLRWNVLHDPINKHRALFLFIFLFDDCCTGRAWWVFVTKHIQELFQILFSRCCFHKGLFTGNTKNSVLSFTTKMSSTLFSCCHK